MTKNEIADVLSEIGVLLELSGENPFKIRAYQSGARALAAMEEAEEMIRAAVEAVKAEAAAEAEAAKASRDQIRRKRDVVGRWQHALQRLLRRMQPLPRCLLRRI